MFSLQIKVNSYWWTWLHRCLLKWRYLGTESYSWHRSYKKLSNWIRNTRLS